MPDAEPAPLDEEVDVDGLGVSWWTALTGEGLIGDGAGFGAVLGAGWGVTFFGFAGVLADGFGVVFACGLAVLG